MTEREAFEKAMRGKGLTVRLEDDGEYSSTYLRGAWIGWQARAALASPKTAGDNQGTAMTDEQINAAFDVAIPEDDPMQARRMIARALLAAAAPRPAQPDDALRIAGASGPLGDPEILATPAAQTAASHVLYTNADRDLPSAICDRNGAVVLRMCKVCGRGEVELDEPCSPAAGVQDRAALAKDIKDSINELAEGRKFPDLMEAVDALAASPAAPTAATAPPNDPECTCGSDSPRAYDHSGTCPHSTPWNERVKKRLASPGEAPAPPLWGPDHPDWPGDK